MSLLIADQPHSTLEGENLDLACTFASESYVARRVSIPIAADEAGGTAAGAAFGSHLPSELRVQDLSSSIRICWHAFVRSRADSCFRLIRGRSGRLYALVRSEPRFNASVASSECPHRLVADGLHHAGDWLNDRTGNERRLKSLVEGKSGCTTDNTGRRGRNYSRDYCEDNAVGH
jgi:hypothetical protein